MSKKLYRSVNQKMLSGCLRRPGRISRYRRVICPPALGRPGPGHRLIPDVLLLYHAWIVIPQAVPPRPQA